MAAGSVMNEPSRGPIVRVVNQNAESEPPSRLESFSMMDSAILRIGRVDARTMITMTNAGSVRFTPCSKYPTTDDQP